MQFECIASPDWVNLLRVWTQVEGLAEFRLGKVILGYQSTLKPDALTQWVNIRRRTPIVLTKRQLKGFAGDFWAWWIDLQPEWRDVAGCHGPLTLEHRPLPAGRNWGQLADAKGRNGVVSVIACLAWWGVHHVVESGPAVLRAEWYEAVADVTYVLDSILEECISA
ncbi:hypothetical protein BDZ89DRAFT_963570 [Hymenopellis radicata]|nr:hypothetical protein BDZ89DRAFT_963570 [Hymenopellis radicata]